MATTTSTPEAILDAVGGAEATAPADGEAADRTVARNHPIGSTGDASAT